MPRTSRRSVLRSLGLVAAGTGGATGALAGFDSTDGESDSDSVVWHRTFGHGDFQCHRVIDTSRGALLVGRTGGDRTATPWLAEIRSDGEPRWTTTFDTDGFTKAVNAVEREDGYTVLVKTDESPAVRLVGLDGEGDEQWRQEVTGPAGTADEDGSQGVASDTNGSLSHAHTLHSTPEGSLLGGYDGPDRARARTDAESTAWLRAVDDDGETRWKRTYGGSAVFEITALAEGYLLAGDADDAAWLQAVDEDGQPRWEHTYGGVDEEYASVAVPTERGVLYGGKTGSDIDGNRAMLVQINRDGEFVWRRTYEPQNVADALSFEKGLVLTGKPRSAGGGRNPEKPVWIVDRWGRAQHTVTVSVNQGSPVGLARFDDDTVAVGGWDNVRGIWLAKIDFTAAD